MSPKTDHPTKELLLNTVIGFLDEMSPNKIQIELVLEKSGISRGSLYHHYKDLDDLVEQAQIARYARYIDASIDILAQILAASKTREQMIENVKAVTRTTQSDALRPARLERTLTIASAISSERMRNRFVVEQDRLTGALADLYREVKERGWGNSLIEPKVAAVMIQSYTFGKVVDDFSPKPMDEKKWIAMIDQLLEKVLFNGE